MEKKSRRKLSSFSAAAATAIVFLLVASFSVVCQTATGKRMGYGSCLLLPIYGNVYPLGYYSVSCYIGNPPKLFKLDIDTGSDLTWIQCDAPCSGCTKPLDRLYKPGNNLLPCDNPLCSAVLSPTNYQCDSATDNCYYEIHYADEASSFGVLVSDCFPLKLTNGTMLIPPVVFGCGYVQKSSSNLPTPTSGVLGLGHGKIGIVSQLQALSIVKHLFGHCFNRRCGGFLFFGDYPIPSGIRWVPMSQSFLNKHYASGPAEILFDGKATTIKGLEFIFDSGSSYTYFNAQVYRTTLNLIKEDLTRKPLTEAPEEKALPICWKAEKPFKSINDVKGYFKPLAISFTQNVQLQLPPEDYLIVTKDGNACLGILNGSEVGLQNLIVIGDIFFQNKLVIYDNEKHQIGWVPSNCDIFPRFVDRAL